MKKWICIAASLILALGMLTACSDNGEDAEGPAESTVFRIASLKGPTTMGMVKLMSDAETGDTAHDYRVNMYGTADEIVPKLINGELDMALVPCNLAAVLYNKTEGAVQVAAINTLGVLYVVESGDTIQTIKDLKGKTVYSTGKGTTPEYGLNYLLKQNGIDSAKDLTIEYKSESTELAVMLAEKEKAIAVMPQPFVTIVQTQNDKVRTALSFSDEWDKVSDDSSLVTGVLLVRKSFAEENKAAFSEFLDEYKASTEYVNANTEDAGVLIEKYGIVPNAVIATKAIPACNITCIEGDEMKMKVGGYLSVLFEANPQSVGGALPEDDFYYQR